MKKFKKYLKFLFVLPLFILALFVNLTISADEIESNESEVNLGTLFNVDYNSYLNINETNTTIFPSVKIDPSTFNVQNYTYKTYYNEDLSFNNYNSYKDFPEYLKNFKIKVSGEADYGNGFVFDTIVDCDVLFNEIPMYGAYYNDIINGVGYYNITRSVHIISRNFQIAERTNWPIDAFLDIWLYYDNLQGIGDWYRGSSVCMIVTGNNRMIVGNIHIEMYNDLTTFNTYLDSLDSGGGYDLGFNDGYNQGYDLGLNDGYNQGYEQGFIDSIPTANITDNLFLSYGIYSNDNQILVNDLFRDSDFTQLNELKPRIIYNLITDEGASANTILISLKNIESNSGYILNMFNGDNSSFELKILGNGGKVLYTRVYDSTTYEISQLLSVVGNNVIIDAISFTFQDIENAENFYISFTNTLLNETFQNGFNVGIYEGESIGYDKGYDEGYRLGHSNGYNEGMSSQFNLGSTLLEIADIPIKVLSSMLSFEVLGINVFGLFTGLVTVLVVLWVVKKFIV